MSEIPGGPDFKQSPDESNFVKAAANEVNKLIRANRVNRAVIATLVAVVAVLVYVVFATHQDSVNNCQAGNSYRSGQTQIWDRFIQLATTGNSSASTRIEASQFRAFIDQVDAQRGCGWTFP